VGEIKRERESERVQEGKQARARARARSGGEREQEQERKRESECERAVYTVAETRQMLHTDTYRHPQTYTVAPKIVPTPSDPHRSLMPSARCMHLPRCADDSCTLRQNCNCVTVHVSLGAEMPNDVGPRVTVDGGRRRILEQYNVTPRPPPYSSTVQTSLRDRSSADDLAT